MSHEAVIKGYIQRNEPENPEYRVEIRFALDALDLLVAERLSLNEQISVAVDMLDKAVTERDEAREVLEGSHARGYREGVREMEAELQAWKVRATEWEKRARAAEARVTELEAAAQGVLDCTEHHDGCPKCIGILRAALADKEGT